MKTNERSQMLFTRIEPDDRQDAQTMADAEYDGNLSLLVRVAVKRMVSAWKRDRTAKKEEVAA